MSIIAHLYISIVPWQGRSSENDVKHEETKVTDENNNNNNAFESIKDAVHVRMYARMLVLMYKVCVYIREICTKKIFNRNIKTGQQIKWVAEKEVGTKVRSIER